MWSYDYPIDILKYVPLLCPFKKKALLLRYQNSWGVPLVVMVDIVPLLATLDLLG